MVSGSLTRSRPVRSRPRDGRDALPGGPAHDGVEVACLRLHRGRVALPTRRGRGIRRGRSPPAPRVSAIHDPLVQLDRRAGALDMRPVRAEDGADDMGTATVPPTPPLERDFERLPGVEGFPHHWAYREGSLPPTECASSEVRSMKVVISISMETDGRSAEGSDPHGLGKACRHDSVGAGYGCIISGVIAGQGLSPLSACCRSRRVAADSRRVKARTWTWRARRSVREYRGRLLDDDRKRQSPAGQHHPVDSRALLEGFGSKIENSRGEASDTSLHRADPPGEPGR